MRYITETAQRCSKAYRQTACIMRYFPLHLQAFTHTQTLSVTSETAEAQTSFTNSLNSLSTSFIVCSFPADWFLFTAWTCLFQKNATELLASETFAENSYVFFKTVVL